MTPTTLRHRPKPLAAFIRREVAASLAPAVIAWLESQPVTPPEEREVPAPPAPDAIQAILEQALFHRDGYRIAAHLELCHSVQPDAHLVAILSAAPILLAAEYDRAWQQWLADNHLGPLPIGTPVLYRHHPALGPGTVVSNDEAAAESRLIFPDRPGTDPDNPGIPYRWEHLQRI